MQGLLVVFLVLALQACANLPDNSGRQPSEAFTDVDDVYLAGLARELGQEQPGDAGFVLLGSGLDAFVARMALAQRAERSIDAQYYLFHGDLTGKLFAHGLLSAADRGVRVRLLVDDMAISGGDLAAAAMDSHPNIEVRVFNPFSRESSRLVQYVTRLGSVTRRMHNKSFTVDNQFSVLGGRNIGDEYFEADPDIAFSDLDVMVFGPTVREVSRSFDLYWNSPLSYPALSLARDTPGPGRIDEMRKALAGFAELNRDSDYLRALRNSPLARTAADGTLEVHAGSASVVYDQPEKISSSRDHAEYRLSTALAPYFEQLEDELIIISPYFVPGKSGTAYLRELANRGVRVVVLTNSLASTDVPVVHAGYAKYRQALLRAGVEVYELSTRARQSAADQRVFSGSSAASLHAKSFIIDRKYVFIGSMNLDPRSAVENTEIGVVFEAPDTAEQMARHLLQGLPEAAFRLELISDGALSESILWHGLEQGKPVTYRVEPYSSAWSRLIVDLAWLLPVESQL